jgi:hypothetical protein
LNWCLFEKEEVAAKGKIAAIYPHSKVHHIPLGIDCWKLWVDEVKIQMDHYTGLQVNSHYSPKK